MDYDKYNPDHRQIYKFIRTLFNAAQLTAECAIITLVYLERLLTYAEVSNSTFCFCYILFEQSKVSVVIKSVIVWVRVLKRVSTTFTSLS